MPFITIEGLEGKVFVPDPGLLPKKHDCRSCFICQHCSDDRCNVCRIECLRDATNHAIKNQMPATDK